jgi:hypothetical protein
MFKTSNAYSVRLRPSLWPNPPKAPSVVNLDATSTASPWRVERLNLVNDDPRPSYAFPGQRRVSVERVVPSDGESGHPLPLAA